MHCSDLNEKKVQKGGVRLPCGEGNGTPLQYSCLENPMDGGAWWAAVHGVAKSRTRLKRLSSSSSRLPCLPLSPGVCSNSCSLSWWCYPTILSSATLFSFCLQSFPASGSFPVHWLFISGGQSIEASASAWVPSMNIQGWFPLGLTGLISLLSKGLTRTWYIVAD